MSLLDRFAREVLPKVKVLGTLPSADDVVGPLDVCVVVLVDRRPSRWLRPHVNEEGWEIDNL